MDEEQENLKDNSKTNIPGECHIVLVVFTHALHSYVNPSDTKGFGTT